ncbi:hypothetical protein M1437_00960 [Patescibacteria group bacterium]|nr:hypothetical protein [Patescibacteria group bacterium]
MRILLIFFIGFLSFFYFAEILNRAVRGIRYSVLGVFFALVGFLIGFFGQSALAGGVNVLAGLFSNRIRSWSYYPPSVIPAVYSF